MEREELRKKNRAAYNEFLLKLNELYDPNEIGSIQNLARAKIMSFIEYCESKNVFYFLELPISEIINELTLEIAKEGLAIDEEAIAIMKKFDDNNIFLLNLLYRIKLYRIRSKYFDLYGVLNEWDFGSIYYLGYKAYYEKAFNNDITSEELKQALDRDNELSIRLGMEEEFSMVKEFIEKKKCKINVYEKKSY